MAKPAKEFRLISTEALPGGITHAVVEFVDDDGVTLERVTIDVPAADDPEAELVSAARNFAVKRQREAARDTALTPGRVFQLHPQGPPA